MSKGNVPLNALRAFETAARHLSFTVAAEELNVTQVAVSRQVKVLERYLETPLFVRGNRSLSLTEDGRRLLPALSGAFDTIDEGVRAISMRGRRDVVCIQAYTTFAQRWLIPRLSSFHSQYPNIEVRISASLSPVDFSHQNLHAAIRSGSGDFSDCKSGKLVPIELVPVCSPVLLASGALSSVDDLKDHTLIQSLARSEDWRFWLESGGYDHRDYTRIIKFENSALCYQAAIEGIGVAIGMTSLVAQDIESGKLVVPFRRTVELDSGYYLVWPSSQTLRGSVKVFHRWLLEQVTTDTENVRSLLKVDCAGDGGPKRVETTEKSVLE